MTGEVSYESETDSDHKLQVCLEDAIHARLYMWHDDGDNSAGVFLCKGDAEHLAHTLLEWVKADG